MLDRDEAVHQLNKLGKKGTPFFFFTDFLGTRAWVKPIGEIDPEELVFSFGNLSDEAIQQPNFRFQKKPLSKASFTKAYDYVVDQINFGNSYLVNLTFSTPVQTDLSLQQIFKISQASYKVRFRDQFVVFSPETFVQIRGGHIYSYPMKGTIDAATPDAERTILNDPKETAEHVTIVDLIRNDLSQVASNVAVTKFRFISKITTHEKKLLQVSSEIRGTLAANYQERLGSIVFQLLPAGSISGAPKDQTIRIIQAAESHQRAFYTGICGYFDGNQLDTGVMIRFIEQQDGQLYYKSGGGITSFSQLDKEYQEIMDKVYLPIF